MLGGAGQCINHNLHAIDATIEELHLTHWLIYAQVQCFFGFQIAIEVSDSAHNLYFTLRYRHDDVDELFCGKRAPSCRRRSTSDSSTSPNAVVYSWSTRQLLGHPRGLVGVSEVES